nr:MAG TPA: hypothetical protein [Caudoviricetes sp.]
MKFKILFFRWFNLMKMPSNLILGIFFIFK